MSGSKTVVHLHNETLRSRKKEGAPTLHDSMAWVGLESILLSEISQVVKGKYYITSPISGT